MLCIFLFQIYALIEISREWDEEAHLQSCEYEPHLPTGHDTQLLHPT